MVDDSYDPTVEEVDLDDEMYDVDSKQYRAAVSNCLELPTVNDEQLYVTRGKKDKPRHRWSETLLVTGPPRITFDRFKKALPGDKCVSIILPMRVADDSAQVDSAGEFHPSPNAGRFMSGRFNLNYSAAKGSGQMTMHRMSLQKVDTLVNAMDLREEFQELNCNLLKFFKTYGEDLVGVKFNAVISQSEGNNGRINDEVESFGTRVDDD